MKVSDNISRILTRPYLLAIVPTLLVILFTPDWYQLYTVKFIRTHALSDIRSFYGYAELDSDRYSELIGSDDYPNGQRSVSISDSGAKLVNEWVFNGEALDPANPLMTGDFDLDGYGEVYVFIYRNDSLFIGYFEPMKNPEGKPNERFISKLGYDHGRFHFTVKPAKVIDLDGDRYGEVIFLVVAGFNKQPRKIFAWDRKNDRILHTPEAAIQLQEIVNSDINYDGKSEILASTYAPGNCLKKEYPYTDSSAWLVVYDHNLDYLFPPLEFPGRASGVQTLAVSSGDTSFIVALVGQRVTGNSKGILMLLDHKGRIVQSKYFPVFSESKYLLPYSRENKFVSGSRDDLSLHIIDRNLDTVESYHTSAEQISNIQKFDADMDGHDELVITDPVARQLILLRGDFSHETRLNIKGWDNTPRLFNRLNGANPPTLVIKDGNNSFEYLYQRNPWYILNYLVYLIIYILSYGIIWVLQYMGRIQMQRRYRLERKIGELQTIAIQNQMDPHFTFTVMNTISAVALKGESEQAYRLTVYFSKMIRASLQDAHTLTRSLAEEIEVVEQYIAIEQEQMEHPPRFIKEIGEEVDLNIRVPKMLLHSFVANALRHGLRPLYRQGCITLQIIKNGEDTIVTISDDGIGRDAAKLNGNTSTGKGLQLSRELLSLLNKNNRRKINWEITDLKGEGGRAAGTRIDIYLPDKYEYNQV